MKEGKLPDGWESIKIRDIATIEKNAAMPDELKENRQNFIGLENIEKDTGKLINFFEISGDELHSTKFKFTSEHILYGKLRPYLNKVFLPDFEGVCSTDILTIKPHPERVLKEYLALALKRSDFVDYATTRSIGANLPRVSPATLLDYLMPLPPLHIQRQIVAILEQAEAMKRLRAESDELTQRFLQSVFMEMFGDPVKNEKGWEITNFGKCFKSIRYGVGLPPIFSDGGIPFVRATNIKNGTILENNMKYVSIEEGKKIEKCRVSKGNLILVRSGVNTGDCAYVSNKFNGSFAAYDLVIELDNPESGIFFNFLINSSFGRSQIDQYKRRAAQEHLNADQVTSLKFPNPPFALQQEFARIVEQVEVLRERQWQSAGEINLLFEGLMQKAFTGGLVA